ncbi:MAG: Spy/CpxP family protein refolding chaperone [Piscinibacter sp.]|nr:Spy/CpxP family protein refolding chaperone [Piscinibacter sp.]
MRLWLRRTLIGLFGASVLFGGLAACSHHHHGSGSAALSEEEAARLRERMVDRVARELKLDEAQKARLAVLAERLRAQRQALVAGSADPRVEVQNLVRDAHFDRWRAQELVNAKLTAVREQSPQVIAAAADFYDGLNAEQQQRVRDFMARRHGFGRWF